LEEEMMKATLPRLLAIVGLVALLTTAAASADESASRLKANLTGLAEVPPTASTATGTFKATVSGQHIDFTLTYSGLTTPAFMAHLHFGQPRVSGGIFVWLCGLPTTPAHKVCPDGTTQMATVTGTITAADIVMTNPDQGINTADFATALRIIEGGNAYANVHTMRLRGGEIRGQVGTGESGSD
jgi:hypothetical protein